MGSFYDIPHPDVFVHLRNATQELAATVPQADVLLTNVVSTTCSRCLLAHSGSQGVENMYSARGLSVKLLLGQAVSQVYA